MSTGGQNPASSVGAWHDAAAAGATVLVHLSAARVGPAHTCLLPPRHQGASDHQVSRQAGCWAVLLTFMQRSSGDLCTLSLSLSVMHSSSLSSFFGSAVKTYLLCSAYGFVITFLSFPPTHHEQYFDKLKLLSMFNGCHFLIHQKQQILFI